MTYRQEWSEFQLGWSELGAPPFPLPQAGMSDGIIRGTGADGMVRGSGTNGRILASVQKSGRVVHHPATEDGVLVGSF